MFHSDLNAVQALYTYSPEPVILYPISDCYQGRLSPPPQFVYPKALS
jgi:hypothetical protein